MSKTSIESWFSECSKGPRDDPWCSDEIPIALIRKNTAVTWWLDHANLSPKNGWFFWPSTFFDFPNRWNSMCDTIHLHNHWVTYDEHMNIYGHSSDIGVTYVLNTNQITWIYIYIYGGVLEIGVPPHHQFHGIFHRKPTILGTPIYGTPQNYPQPATEAVTSSRPAEITASFTPQAWRHATTRWWGFPYCIAIIPNILGSIIPKLIINQAFEHCSPGV